MFPDCQFLFFMHVLVFILPFLPLHCHCFLATICMYVCYVLFNKYSILNKYVINITIYNHSNTLRGRVASNSGERWDQVHLVPSNFRDWLSGRNMGRRRKRKGNRQPHHCGAVPSNVEAEVAPMLPLAEAIWIFVNWTSDWSRLFSGRETAN